MKYQGVTDVCFEVTDTLGLRVSFSLVTRDGQYSFDPYNMQFFTATNENELLSNYNYDMQKHILKHANVLMDNYIAEFDNELLVALATDKLLARLDKRNYSSI